MRCQRQDLLLKTSECLHSNYLLCAQHFENSQFMNAADKNKLVLNAVPSLFDTEKPQQPVECIAAASLPCVPADCGTSLGELQIDNSCSLPIAKWKGEFL